jgi:hypothetical protein
MKTPDDNIQLLDYAPYRLGHARMLNLYGTYEIAIAIHDGFRWHRSTDTHDIFRHRELRIERAINKETKRFYETRI